MLQQLYLRYLKSLLVFSILTVGIYILLRWLIGAYLSPNMPYLIIGFVLFTALTHFIIVQADSERILYRPSDELSKEERMQQIAHIERKFISRYMLVTGIKLICFLILLILYTYFNRKDITRFSVGFIVIYLMYSIFEIFQIRRPVVGKTLQNANKK
jgi:L-lactate permease